MEYALYYKHYKLHNFLIEICKSFRESKYVFSAKTNFLFYDKEDESWGHAVGIGDNEEKALEMCLKEIKQYLKDTSDYEKIKEAKIQDLKQIDIPCKIIFTKGNGNLTYYYKENKQEIEILTTKKKISMPIINNDIALTFEKNLKNLDKSSYDDYSQSYFITNNFTLLFDNLYCRYGKQNLIDIQ